MVGFELNRRFGTNPTYNSMDFRSGSNHSKELEYWESDVEMHFRGNQIQKIELYCRGQG